MHHPAEHWCCLPSIGIANQCLDETEYPPAGSWDVPLPEDMDTLIQGLLAEADMAPESSFCSRAFQADLDAFLRAQVLF